MGQLRYRTDRRRVGRLNCAVVHSGQAAKAVAILCHGFGAPGDDLLGLAGELLESRESQEPVELIFPQGLISLEDQGFAEGRAWWQLSIQRLIQAMESGQYELIREESPAGIEEASSAIKELVEDSLIRNGLTAQQLLLGGFSQGAMLSMECACNALASPPGGLVLYSGCLIRERQWKPLASRLAQTKILQSHGTMDMILPLQTGLWLYELLQSSGCEVDFIRFQGPHTIPWDAIEKTTALLDSLI